MDRLPKLQRHQRLPSTRIKEEEVDPAERELYTYIPRRRGDFPDITDLPSDIPPRGTRYDIVSRKFEDDVPFFVIRPRVGQTTSEGEVKSSQEREEEAPSSTRNNTLRTSNLVSQQPAYDPLDASLLRVSLFDIVDYVTPRELERFESWRFENPQAEDFPPIKQTSRASSTAALHKVERGRQERSEGGRTGTGRPRGRPAKKKQFMGVVVHQQIPVSGSEIRRSFGEETARSTIKAASGSNGIVRDSIEEVEQDEDMVDAAEFPEHVDIAMDVERDMPAFESLQLTRTQATKSLSSHSTESNTSSSTANNSLRKTQQQPSLYAHRQIVLRKSSDTSARPMLSTGLSPSRRSPGKSPAKELPPVRASQPKPSGILRYLTSNPKKLLDSSPQPSLQLSQSKPKKSSNSSPEPSLQQFRPNKKRSPDSSPEPSLQLFKSKTNLPPPKQIEPSPLRQSKQGHKLYETTASSHMPIAKSKSPLKQARHDKSHFEIPDSQPLITNKPKMNHETTPRRLDTVSRSLSRDRRQQSSSRSEISDSQPSDTKQRKQNHNAISIATSTSDSESESESEAEEILVSQPAEGNARANEDAEYEISNIIMHDDSRGKRYYLVAWVGYDDGDATWLTEDELEGAKDALDEYHRSLAGKGGF